MERNKSCNMYSSLKQECKTGWDTEEEMGESVLGAFQDTQSIFLEQGQMSLVSKDILQQFVLFLQSFKLSGSKYPTINWDDPNHPSRASSLHDTETKKT